MLGTVVSGSYRITAALGGGAMGEVWAAENLRTGGQVAIKLIRDDGQPDRLARLQREARSAGSLDTKHIVRVLDLGTDPALGRTYLVMERLRGEDLAGLLAREGALAPATALAIAAQACAGLRKAHEAGVTHRDVKPANLFLAEDDDELTVKLLDFGLAKSAEEDVQLTRSGTESLLGSPLYMSPEQAVAPRSVDHRTDLWSLGVVLYTMLAGHAPFAHCATLSELLLALYQGEIPDLATTVDERVRAVVARCLKREPAERWATASELFDALNALLPQGRGLTTLAKAAPSRVAAKDPAGVFHQPAVAVLPFDNMSGDKEQEYFADGLTEDIITALAAWRSFPVIARNSTFAYKGKSSDVRQVGKELGARYVLEGGVRKGGARIRITAQLIDASTGHHIWAERYDRQIEDIFALQDEITTRIVAIVAPEVERAEQRRSLTKEPASLAAWECHQRGMALLEDFTAASNAQARVMFERAIAIDASYGLAYAGLAFSHNRDLMLELSSDREQSAARALEAARRAVELDPADSYARCMMAVAYTWPNRHDAALEQAERAVQLNPSNGLALGVLAMTLDAVGRHDDALVRFEQFTRVSPRDPRMHVFRTALARSHVAAHRYDAAIAAAGEAIEQRPDYAHAHHILASALGHVGRLDEARTALAACERLQPGYVARRARWQPYKDESKNQHVHAGVRAAQ